MLSSIQIEIRDGICDAEMFDLIFLPCLKRKKIYGNSDLLTKFVLQFMAQLSLSIVEVTSSATTRRKISQASHVIELFHGSWKVVFVQDWISSELDLEYIELKG